MVYIPTHMHRFERGKKQRHQITWHEWATQHKIKTRRIFECIENEFPFHFWTSSIVMWHCNLQSQWNLFEIMFQRGFVKFILILFHIIECLWMLWLWHVVHCFEKKPASMRKLFGNTIYGTEHSTDMVCNCKTFKVRNILGWANELTR